MKLLIIIVIVLGGAIGLGMYAMEDPGYVVISREPYTIRMSLALLVGFLLVLFMVLYLLLGLLTGLVQTPRRIRQWRMRKREQGAQQLTMKGFTHLIEGDWTKAEESLLASRDDNRASLMNYLGAAYAAQQQGLIDRRNAHLGAALKAFPHQAVSVRLTWARMEMQSGHWMHARSELESVRLKAPQNRAAVQLLAETYRQLGDWSSLVKLLPVLHKLMAFPEEELRRREVQALQGHLGAPALQPGSSARLDEVYEALPKKVRTDTVALASYARQLMHHGEHSRAEFVLRKALNRSWNGELIRLYGQLETPHLSDQIRLLQSWGKGHEEDTGLKWALAALHRRDNNLEEARTLLAQVVSDTGDAEAVEALGDLLEQMGESEKALMMYRQGLKTQAHPPAEPPDFGVSQALPDGSSTTGEFRHSIIPVASDR